MGDKERERLILIKGAIGGVYTVGYVAKVLGIKTRRVKALKKAVREQGDSAVIHGNSGKHPKNYTDEKIRKRIICLKKSAGYFDTNFTYFRELLEDRENIKIGYTALSKILKNAGIISKKTHSNGGKKFKRRKRRSQFGELLQADATSFDWFGTGERLALHGFIDDATGRLVGLYMCQNECLQGYLETLRQTILKYGIPLELYTDKAGLFFVNTKNPDNWTLDEQLAGKTLNKTQFSTITDRLGITLIAAHSPQAKGRVERLWGTLQDRLVTYLRLEKITNTALFNLAADQIMDWFNKRFEIESESSENSFVPLSEGDNLDTLLAVKYERTTDTCGCFSFQNIKFEVDSDKIIAKKKIIFLFSERIGFQAMYDKKLYPVKPLDFLKKNTRLPEVTKSLLNNFYFTDGKKNSPLLL